MNVRKNQTDQRLLSREIARELTAEELLQVAGAAKGNPVIRSTCTGSDNNPCDLDWDHQ